SQQKGYLSEGKKEEILEQPVPMSAPPSATFENNSKEKDLNSAQQINTNKKVPKLKSTEAETESISSEEQILSPEVKKYILKDPVPVEEPPKIPTIQQNEEDEEDNISSKSD